MRGGEGRGGGGKGRGGEGERGAETTTTPPPHHLGEGRDLLLELIDARFHLVEFRLDLFTALAAVALLAAVTLGALELVVERTRSPGLLLPLQ